MLKELEEIADYLKVHYRYGNTTEISEPDKWEDKEYVSCDDKVINYIDGYYHISDMSDIHQTLRFKTKKEVLQFFNGHSEGYQFYFENDDDAAFAIGKLTTIIDLMGDKETQDAFMKRISPFQKKYKTQNADADKE
jgi:hypothetical protein